MKAIDLRKELGLKPKDISIRIENCGYSESIRVEIKNLLISKSDIENKLAKYRDVGRCEVTGEILQGGNTYVTVNYNSDSMKAASKKIKSDVEKLYNKISDLPPHLLQVIGTFDGTDILMFHDHDNHYIRLRDAYQSSYIYNVDDLSKQLIRLNAQGKLVIDGLPITDLILS